jgi:hypothetical protein
MATLSKKQAETISNLINSLLVYSTMAHNDVENRASAMKWFNEACDDLAQFNISTIKFDIKA